MKQTASSHTLYSPKPIRTCTRPIGPQYTPPLAPGALYRNQANESCFRPCQDDSLEALIGLPPNDEDIRLFEMALVEKDLTRRCASMPLMQPQPENKLEGITTRRSCPHLPVQNIPERPSNPMVRDGRFNFGTVAAETRCTEPSFGEDEYNETSSDC